MGIISVEHSDNLFWLGRYTERVYTTLLTFFDYYDKALDGDGEEYKLFLEKLGIDPQIYKSLDEFADGFLYDEGEVFSVISAFERMYGNAVCMREEIGSDALSYIQLAFNKFKAGKGSHNMRYKLMRVVDYLLAFWGCILEELPEDDKLNIIQCGKVIERLDLLFRFSYDYRLIETEYEKLCHRLANVEKGNPYKYNTAQLSVLVEVVGMKEAYSERLDDVLLCLDRLFETEAA